MSSSQRSFRPVTDHPLKTQGGVPCSNQLIFLRNNAKKTYDCLSMRSPQGAPRYSIPLRPQWEDEVIIGFAVSPSSISQRPTIFVLRKSNVLDVYSLENGRLLNTVYIGCLSKGVFKEMTYDYESGLLVLKSVRKSKTSNEVDDDVLVSFVLFQHPPFKFVARFEVRKSVFGDKILDADLVCQTLMVLEANSVTKVYNARHLLDGIDEELNIGDIRGDSTEILTVGDSPLGLPINLEIKRAPPCLLIIKSYKQYIQLSPSYNFISCDLKDHCFKLRRLGDHSLVGMLGQRDSEGQDHVGFTPDDASRVIQINSSSLRIHEFSKDSLGLDELMHLKVNHHEGRHCLKYLNSGCKLCKSEAQKTDPPKLMSKSGRKLKTRLNSTDLLGKSRNISWDYEDELDVLVVLAHDDISDDESDESITGLDSVVLLDNQTLKVIKEVPIHQVVRRGFMMPNVFVSMDRDILIIQVESGVKTSTFLYQLVEDFDGTKSQSKPTKFRSSPPRRPSNDVRTLRRRSTWSDVYFDDVDMDSD